MASNGLTKQQTEELKNKLLTEDKKTQEIIQKLKTVQSRIGRIIKSVERNECTENIIIQINKAQRMLRTVRCLILKDYLVKITGQSGFPEKEILKYHELIN